MNAKQRRTAKRKRQRQIAYWCGRMAQVIEDALAEAAIARTEITGTVSV